MSVQLGVRFVGHPSMDYELMFSGIPRVGEHVSLPEGLCIVTGVIHVPAVPTGYTPPPEGYTIVEVKAVVAEPSAP